MADFINARVIQKIATVSEWSTSTIIPYKGEIMLVSDGTGKVVNIKVGDGINHFNDLPYMFDESVGAKFVTLVGDQVFTYQDDISNIVDKEQITLTATEYNFTGAPEDRKWQYLYNGLWIDIPGTFNTLTYNLHHQSAIWHGGDSVVIRYSVGEIYDQITIIKVYKGVGELKVVVQSDYGDIFINGNIDTTLRAYAYWGGELINDDLDDTAFQWFRTSGNPAEDVIWNYNKGRNKKAVKIDSSDVYRKAVFECEVTLNI